jgi:hypothetical protein
MQDHPQITSLLNTFFWITVTIYIIYKLIRNIGCLIWLVDSLWYASFRLAHFCIGVFDRDA